MPTPTWAQAQLVSPEQSKPVDRARTAPAVREADLGLRCGDGTGRTGARGRHRGRPWWRSGRRRRWCGGRRWGAGPLTGPGRSPLRVALRWSWTALWWSRPPLRSERLRPRPPRRRCCRAAACSLGLGLGLAALALGLDRGTQLVVRRVEQFALLVDAGLELLDHTPLVPLGRLEALVGLGQVRGAVLEVTSSGCDVIGQQLAVAAEDVQHDLAVDCVVGIAAGGRERLLVGAGTDVGLDHVAGGLGARGLDPVAGGLDRRCVLVPLGPDHLELLGDLEVLLVERCAALLEAFELVRKAIGSGLERLDGLGARTLSRERQRHGQADRAQRCDGLTSTSTMVTDGRAREAEGRVGAHCGEVNHMTSNITITCRIVTRSGGSFPLDRAGWLGRDVVRNPVHPGDLVDDP